MSRQPCHAGKGLFKRIPPQTPPRGRDERHGREHGQKMGRGIKCAGCMGAVTLAYFDIDSIFGTWSRTYFGIKSINGDRYFHIL